MVREGCASNSLFLLHLSLQIYDWKEKRKNNRPYVSIYVLICSKSSSCSMLCYMYKKKKAFFKHYTTMAT